MRTHKHEHIQPTITSEEAEVLIDRHQDKVAAIDLHDYITGQSALTIPAAQRLNKRLGFKALEIGQLNTLTFTLPWPPKMLHPNTPGHWAAKAQAKKAYRTACKRIVQETEGHMPPMGPDDALRVSMRFYPPNKRTRDWDNLMACMKSGLDGIADGLGVNDSLFRPTVEVDDQIGGFVRVTVEIV